VVLGTSAGREVSAQRLLVAVGRRPATAGLGLDAAGVRGDERGFVVVDEHMATTAKGVYAAGDVTGLFPHTHAAYAMGRVAVGAALRRFRRPSFDATAIPQVVFTDPEIATVGAVEHDVTDRRARVAFLPMSDVDRAITADRTQGFVKLIAGPRPMLGNLGGGRVLGATIMCQRAGQLIHEPPWSCGPTCSPAGWRRRCTPIRPGRSRSSRRRRSSSAVTVDTPHAARVSHTGSDRRA
jgi:pyruvate/2-oxoglutarate dehydrogenase complex dihydrolipoamide dehydrogenase (E3) component